MMQSILNHPYQAGLAIGLLAVGIALKLAFWLCGPERKERPNGVTIQMEGP